jgi:hypothetical protein
MASPFPGMNPYLEQEDVWHDFHQRFPVVAAAMLTAQVDPRYIVKIDQHTFIHELSAEERRPFGRPDLHVTPSGTSTPLPSSGGVAVEGFLPILMPAVDVERQPFIEIRDRESRRVITVVELLSPCNKYAGADREQYLGKRSNLLRSKTHLVEIDLLRGGPRLPYYSNLATEYAVFISRAEERPRAGVLPIRLREPLPTIPIPLQAPDRDITLDLQAVLHHVYDAAAYKTYIYQGKPQPALSPADAAWAQQFLPVGLAPNAGNG